VAKAKKGDNVKVHYTGRLEDGTVFDSSHDREPLEFTLGEGQVIQGFETAVDGMAEGETKTTKIPAEEGYGDRREEMVIELERGKVPSDIQPEVGQNLQIQLQNGEQLPVVVTAVEDEKVVIDANHPLAGKTLVFDIELVEAKG
jgi:peptidylprolyl isomerase